MTVYGVPQSNLQTGPSCRGSSVRQTPLAVLLIGVLLLSGGCAAAPEISNNSQAETSPAAADPLGEAREVLSKGDDSRIIEYFGSKSADPSSLDLEPGELYQVGKAYFTVARNSIAQSRKQEHTGLGFLPEPFVNMLKISRDSLLQAADAQPNADFAAEAYYLAGQVMDHGFLQDFEKAMETYRWAASAYPGSVFGNKAAKRYKELLGKFNGMIRSPHGN